ncbi:MAG: hypothetical protein OXF88_08425 [Rhodobacteraceae bacterium]|nr:hypothetical protein [Paracoccaceae bacterium]MCY4139992.1 hypothetical protein [Paracoccaceae bacterium]
MIALFGLFFAIADVIRLAVLECSVMEYSFSLAGSDVGSLVWPAIPPFVSIHCST